MAKQATAVETEQAEIGAFVGVDEVVEDDLDALHSVSVGEKVVVRYESNHPNAKGVKETTLTRTSSRAARMTPFVNEEEKPRRLSNGAGTIHHKKGQMGTVVAFAVEGYDPVPRREVEVEAVVEHGNFSMGSDPEAVVEKETDKWDGPVSLVNFGDLVDVEQTTRFKDPGREVLGARTTKRATLTVPCHYSEEDVLDMVRSKHFDSYSEEGDVEKVGTRGYPRDEDDREEVVVERGHYEGYKFLDDLRVVSDEDDDSDDEEELLSDGGEEDDSTHYSELREIYVRLTTKHREASERYRELKNEHRASISEHGYESDEAFEAEIDRQRAEARADALLLSVREIEDLLNEWVDREDRDGESGS